MQKNSFQEIFDPGDYDPDFSFSLDLSLIDYLLLSLYLVFVAPLEVLLWVVKFVYRTVAEAIEYMRNPAEAKPHGGLLSVVSKIF